ncbi:MAG: flagellar biosynthetic protein FliO [candidate division Zixibacteria bacterium]|nr:flagellar biosynthetic protein FliO [candidate division Zixibacteria bacterium]
MTRITARISLVFVAAFLMIAPVADAVPGDTAKAVGQSYLSGAESPVESVVTPLTEGLFPSMTKVIFVLLGVIIAIYFTLSIVKKGMGRRATGGGRGDVIEIIETCYLAPKQSICLVRIGGRGALLGVTEKSINSLVELSAEEILAAQKAELSKDGSLSFKDALGKARRKIVDLGNYRTKFKRKDRTAIGV